MVLKYYIYGEVVFTSTAKRTAAGRRLDSRTTKAGFVAEAWAELINVYGNWPSGKGDVLKDGLPALRFCYMTTDPVIATESIEEISSAWDVFQDSESFWSYTAVPG